jgi:hypothetical protein
MYHGISVPLSNHAQRAHSREHSRERKGRSARTTAPFAVFKADDEWSQRV